MNEQELLQIIHYWQKDANDGCIFPRDIVSQIPLRGKEIIDIVGPRRSGKSFLLKFLMRSLSPKEYALYINFEDPYFLQNKSWEVIEALIEAYQRHVHPSLQFLFFDEIQNIPFWEKVLRKYREGARYHMFIAGSSSKLLGGELATVLTGRHLSFEMMPLSFVEFLQFRQEDPPGDLFSFVKNETVLRKLFSEFLQNGGFPEVVSTRRESLLRQYYGDMIQRDIIDRYDIREKDILKSMGVFLITQSGKTVSIASLKKLYGISYHLVSSFLQYFQEAFLLFLLPQFSFSLKTQHKAFKKIYAIDTGLASAVSFRFSEDKERMLENSVFLHLRKEFKELFYYKTKSGAEIDFIAKQHHESFLFIQVVWSLEDTDVKERELKAMKEGLKELPGSSGMILTFQERGFEKIGKKKIPVIPVYQWMLRNRLSSKSMRTNWKAAKPV